MNKLRRSRTPALTAAFAILRFLAQASTPAASLSEIHRAVSLNKSTCLAVLRHLERLEAVTRDGGRRYRLGPVLIQLGQAAAGSSGLLDLVRPALWRLHQATHLTAMVARREGLHIVVVDSFEPTTEVHVRVPVGVPLHLTTGALGKCLLAFSPDEEVRTLLARAGVARFTERSARSVNEYLDELQRVRRRGYAESFEEFSPGVHAVAAPVLAPGGTVALVMALAGFSSALPRDRVRREGLRLRAAAQAVTRGIGQGRAAVAGSPAPPPAGPSAGTGRGAQARTTSMGKGA